MSRQGFVTIGTDPYVYIENTVNNTVSTSMGIDSAGTGLFNINLSTSAGAAPGVGFQPVSIDPVTGVILFTPLGGGFVRVDGPLDITGGITFAGNITTTNSAASAAANSLVFQKNRSAGIITTGDALGQVYFDGYDGTQYVRGASITATTSGTIAANRVASNLVFSTHPDSASGVTPTTRMTIASTGAITIAAPDSGVALTITDGGQTITAGSLLITAGEATLTNGDANIGNTDGAATAPFVTFKKSRAGGVITTGDDLGEVAFQGHDGGSYFTSARIRVDSSGTIAAGRIASTMQFYTAPDSVTASTLRMSIAPTGAVTIAAPDSGVGLTISGGGETITAGDLTVTAGEVGITNGDVTVGNTDAGVTAPFINFNKSRSGAVITSGDDLGEIAFKGFDSATYFTSARIRVDSSGTIGAGRVASTMQFYTAPDSVTVSTLRMSIAPTGEVTIASPDSGTGLTVSGGGATITAGDFLVTAGEATLTNGDANIGNTDGAATAPFVNFKKSRAGGIITTGDDLGEIAFQGHDGGSYFTSARIRADSSGTIGAGRIASTMQFYTAPDSVTASTLRMSIAPTGEVTIATPDSGVGLTIAAGGQTITAGDFETTNGDVLVGNTDAGITAPFVTFKKSRTGGVITSGDDIGEVAFTAHDGTSFFTSARIRVDSSGTIAAGRVASTMQFYTAPDSATSSTLRMSIAPTGEVTVAAPDSGTALTITAGGETITAGDFLVTAGEATLTNGDANIGNTDAGVTAPFVNFKKSRSGGAITSGDDIGEIAFTAHDGTSYFTSARIRADSSGTIAAGRVASTMQFYTAPDSATSSTLRMSIAPTGAVTIATPDSGVGLTVSGGGETITAGDVTLTNGNVVISTANTGITLEGGLRIISRATTPNGVVTAPKGSLCLVANGSGVADRMFINTDSGTTWTAVATIA